MDLGEEFAGGIEAIPIITRAYLGSVALIAFLAHFGYISTLQLYYNYRLVFLRHEYWRLVTNFLYFGPINFDFLFHLFFMTRYFRVLEDQSFSGKPADFLFMLLFGAAIMLVIGAIFHITFLSASLSFMVIYVWAKRNPRVMMNFLGFMNFPATHMPFVLLVFSFLVSGTLPKSDAIGIFSGHIYYYLVDIVPRFYHKHPLQTPTLLKRLFRQDIGEEITLRQALQEIPPTEADAEPLVNNVNNNNEEHED